MRFIATILMAVLTMATMNGQTLTERQNERSSESHQAGLNGRVVMLEDRVKGLAACACLMAQGDLERLEPAVKMALNNGVTINELKEAFSQLYAYTGFPRSLNALGVLSKVLENNGRRASLGRAQRFGMMLQRL